LLNPGGAAHVFRESRPLEITPIRTLARSAILAFALVACRDGGGGGVTPPDVPPDVPPDAARYEIADDHNLPRGGLKEGDRLTCQQPSTVPPLGRSHVIRWEVRYSPDDTWTEAVCTNDPAGGARLLHVWNVPEYEVMARPDRISVVVQVIGRDSTPVGERPIPTAIRGERQIEIPVTPRSPASSEPPGPPPNPVPSLWVPQAKPLNPPARYRDLWRSMEECTGRKGDFDGVRWYLMESDGPDGMFPCGFFDGRCIATGHVFLREVVLSSSLWLKPLERQVVSVQMILMLTLANEQATMTKCAVKTFSVVPLTTRIELGQAAIGLPSDLPSQQ